MIDGLEKELKNFINEIKKHSNYISSSSNNKFPTRKQLNNEPLSNLPLIVEQAEKLLKNQDSIQLGGVKFWDEDKEGILQLFIDDLKLYSTENNIALGNDFIASYGQIMISDHAIFHIARSRIFSKSYKSIDLLNNNSCYEIYSIPFAIRVALENKFKKIIGFKSCDVTRYKKTKTNEDEFPFSSIIQELIKLKCLNLPCSLYNISNIYSWSCRFCHTGKKEYIWLSLKALELLSPLFLHEEQKKHEVNITSYWDKKALTEKELCEKMIEYKGSLNPIYYFEKGWSTQKLQEKLNQSKLRSLEPYTFYLSSTEFDECNSFYCSKHEEYY